MTGFRIFVTVVMLYTAWRMSNYYKTLSLPAQASRLTGFRRTFLAFQFTVAVVTLLVVAVAVHKPDGAFG